MTRTATSRRTLTPVPRSPCSRRSGTPHPLTPSTPATSHSCARRLTTLPPQSHLPLGPRRRTGQRTSASTTRARAAARASRTGDERGWTLPVGGPSRHAHVPTSVPIGRRADRGADTLKTPPTYFLPSITSRIHTMATLDPTMVAMAPAPFLVHPPSPSGTTHAPPPT